MARYLYNNNAASTLLGSIGPTDTSITLPGGHGARFPNPVAANGESFMLTIEDTSGNLEIVECTGRATDILTVVRGREGTIARAFDATTPVDMRITAGMLGQIDWTAHTAVANGVAQLDGTGKLPIAQFDTPLQVYGDARWNLALGFTPVQQGTGVNQTSDVVKVGWSAASKLKLTIGAADQGNIALESWVTGSALAFSAAKWGTARSLTLTGVVTGTTTQDGSANASLATSIADGALSIAKTSGLQGALDGKLSTGGGTITGNLTVTGTMTAASVVDTSDARIKALPQPMTLDDALRIIRESVPVRYHNLLTGRDDFGMIADDQETVTPELIVQDAEGARYKGVAYQRLVAPIIVVLQHLLAREVK